jgi:hypothetical protein
MILNIYQSVCQNNYQESSPYPQRVQEQLL